MKSKIFIIVIVVAALIVGVFIGVLSTNCLWNRYTLRYFVYMPASNQIYQSVRVLTALHDGRQSDAMETEEMALDDALITFTSNEGTLPDKLDPSWLKSIRVARDYRIAHLYSGSSVIVSNAVQQVFSTVK
jgi:hypothetical protein